MIWEKVDDDSYICNTLLSISINMSNIVRGSKVCAVDDKRRISIPFRMRDVFVGEKDFVLTRGVECCLQLYPRPAWEVVASKLMAMKESMLSPADEKSRFEIRMILQWTEDVRFDVMGRILMTPALIEYAQLNGSALVIGVLDHVEIWSPKEFRKYEERMGGYAAVA